MQLKDLKKQIMMEFKFMLLISFFLSRFFNPLVNHRNDSFGGSTENRIKILIEILKGIKEKNLNYIYL